MRILITNLSMFFRSGTELYVRDLALALTKRRHEVAVFTPKPGQVSDELKRFGITVFQSLSECPEPEIVHGQHSWETMAAAARFPATPMIFVGHDYTSWHDTPPRLPQIRRYVAVDWSLKVRFVQRHGVPEKMVRIIPNPIDFERFRRRGPLPPRPSRALILSNYMAPRHRDIIAEACNRHGIQLDAIGAKFGNKTNRPEEILCHYDLVFAKGRTALEAAAVGAAIIPCDVWGCAPRITTKLLHSHGGVLQGRLMDFVPLTVKTISERIEAYDPEESAQVSRIIRTSYDSDRITGELIDLYESAIAECEDFSEAENRRALAAELTSWAANLEAILQYSYDANVRRHAQFDSAPAVGRSSLRLAGPVRGGGWYPAEHDDNGAFRWMGPEPWAWIELTLPQSDKVRLEIEVVHALRPDIIEQSEAKVNGWDVPLEVARMETGWKLSGEVPIRAGRTGAALVLILIPRAVSPCDLDAASKDYRRLGLGVRSIALLPVQE